MKHLYLTFVLMMLAGIFVFCEYEGGYQDSVETAWLELPATDDPSLEYYSHSFEMDGQKYRNYTFAWSNGDYLAKWVAYPINKTYSEGKYGGSRDWTLNPQVDEMFQPDFKKSFGFSRGYERGHQIANADRKCCPEANAQTYFFTNSTLQHKDFNGEIWATLEANVRKVPVTEADTCYVLTGCVVSPDAECIPDPDGRLVPIPEAYFKAVLSYSPSSQYGVWQSAAFYLEHRPYSHDYISAEEVMTVDELEAKLGMNMFVNLPAKIGEKAAAAVEAQNPLLHK